MVKDSGSMKLDYLIREMVWSSTLSYYNLDLEMKDTAWVLISWDIDIIEMPSYNKDYQVQTQARGYYKFYAMRDFTISNEETCLVRAKTLWMLIDIKTRSIVPMPDELKKYFPYLDKDSVKDYMVKLPRTEESETYPIEIHNEDIDSNGHVSNAVYFKWFENSLDFKSYSRIRYRRIRTLYKKEILAHENIAYRKTIKEKVILFEVINQDTNEHKASVEIELT